MDPLLKKVFARVGFLQARLAKNFPEETQAFFMDNPELALLIMREMVERREADSISGNLPPMNQLAPPSPFGSEEIIIQGPRHRGYAGPIYR